ncbi:MAG: RecQ family ATP-dependent DNA helicase [Bacteroidetes bacterium]|nr:RecQ family ATP-dependent DNA helicase [Bacteroidota bacterium]
MIVSRPLQEDIIESVLNGIDTLALLPTGGGKSVCFQVPAMAMEGICIVVSPLIALMKDQVENLQAKGIKAVAVFSGMSRDEVDIALDNCIYGHLKFLYLSPERLLSDLVRERIQKMNVCLFAIDEAHCISQWGYDFRPSYMRIAEIRDLHPSVPILALTASATPEVRTDIMKQLAFKKEHLFQKSFARENLNYLCYHMEDKQRKMIEIFSKVRGTGIVYVRNRKRTREYAQLLQQYKISADFYHAGLSAQLRNEKQDQWKSGKTRVMVCTNAFGMGIDKPDVRTVIHMDLPDSPEAYYQEAGRAGRDEKTAYAIVLYNETDIADLKRRQETSFPAIKEIRNVYQAIANYLQVPVDSGMGVSYDFEITKFISNYNFNPITALSCLRVLEAEGLISVSDAVFIPSRVHFKVNNIDLYTFQVTNFKYDILIKTILRSAEGVFDEFVKISEPELANKLKITYDQVVSMLTYLHKNDILSYEPRKDSPQLTFTTPREEAVYIDIDEKKYLARKEKYILRSEAVANYVTSKHLCRSMILLNYFGEKATSRCGVCDYCRELNKQEFNEIELDNFRTNINSILKNEGPLNVVALLERSGINDSKKALEMITWMIDQEYLKYNKKVSYWRLKAEIELNNETEK